MTIIAYKAGVISCDSLAVCGGNKSSIKKWENVGNDLLFSSGTYVDFLQFVEWYKTGAKPEMWPSGITSDNYSRVIVCKGGKVLEYEHLPYPIKIIDDFAAWGSGRDYAIGAMYMGADTVQACMAAISHSTGCGGKIHTFKLFNVI